MDHQSFLMEQLHHIEQWEKEQKRIWFWEKMSRLPFMLLDRLTPAWIHKKWRNCLMSSDNIFKQVDNIS